jgi:hypothetical protein
MLTIEMTRELLAYVFTKFALHFTIFVLRLA